MSYFGIPRGRSKAAPTLRITIDNDNLTNNATLYSDSGAGSTITVATGSWTQLVASLPQVVNFLEIFDSTGFTSRIGTGAASSEVDLMLDTPGGNGHIPVLIAASTRLALRPLTHPPAGGEIVINFWD